MNELMQTTARDIIWHRSTLTFPEVLYLVPLQFPSSYHAVCPLDCRSFQRHPRVPLLLPLLPVDDQYPRPLPSFWAAWPSIEMVVDYAFVPLDSFFAWQKPPQYLETEIEPFANVIC